MTKKNSEKRAARQRQARLGGSYLHHLNQIRDVAPAATTIGATIASALPIDRLLLLARAAAPRELALAAATDAPQVYVIADAADPIGEALVAAGLARERGIETAAVARELREEVRARFARGEAVTYGELMTWPVLQTMLAAAVPSSDRVRVTALRERFTSEPAPGSVHVLAVGAGELRVGSVPRVETCLCGHPVAQHEAHGSCTWVGIPTGEPFLGLTKEMVEFARANSVVMRCPCGGKPMMIDGEGRLAPLGPAILKWPKE